MEKEEIIYIGKKSVMTYVMAALQILNAGEPKITIKARGNFISRAVDVTEVLRNRFATNVVVEEIKIDTEKLTRDGETHNVSTIDIILIASPEENR